MATNKQLERAVSVESVQGDLAAMVDTIRTRAQSTLKYSGDTSETCQLIAVRIALDHLDATINGIESDDLQ